MTTTKKMKTVLSSAETRSETMTSRRSGADQHTVIHACKLECGHEQEWSKSGRPGWQAPLCVKCKVCAAASVEAL